MEKADFYIVNLWIVKLDIVLQTTVSSEKKVSLISDLINPKQYYYEYLLYLNPFLDQWFTWDGKGGGM